MDGSRTPQRRATRWELIRDIAVFQLKAGVDALRDLALVPVSLVAGALDLISGGEKTGRLFYDVMDAGRRTEDWINLFGDLHDHSSSQTRGHLDAAHDTVDSVVARLENLIVEQYERGGMTATAKNAIDRALDAFSTARSASRGIPNGEDPDP